MSTTRPAIRWGILGTGWVSTEFVKDLLTQRKDAKAHHIVQALGTSSKDKGEDFVKRVFEKASPEAQKPTIYTSYDDVYNDPRVDIVYVGTPHSYHLANTKAAIAAGKHVLCEKPMTVNAAESEEMVKAAKDKGVFLMEAVWIRFFPIVQDLQRLIHEEKVIGEPYRMFCDFGLELHLENLPPSNRYKDPALGGGALLDIGIYPLTWASVLLQTGLGSSANHPKISASMIINEGVDWSDSVTLHYPGTNRLAICTATVFNRTPETFCRLEGSEGVIEVSGPAASVPRKITIKRPEKDDEVREYEPETGTGFFWEADSVAIDVAEGRKESRIMPLDESLRMMKLMDDIRRLCGLKYPQDGK